MPIQFPRNIPVFSLRKEELKKLSGKGEKTCDIYFLITYACKSGHFKAFRSGSWGQFSCRLGSACKLEHIVVLSLKEKFKSKHSGKKKTTQQTAAAVVALLDA